MKTNATIHSARLKNEVKRRKGEIVSSEAFWLVTLKIPAGRIDANEVSQNVDELLTLALEAVQTRLPLKQKQEVAA